MDAGHHEQHTKRRALPAASFLLGAVLALCPVHALAVGEGGDAVSLPKPRLFGTVEFRRPLEKQQNWLSVLRRNAEEPVFSEGKLLGGSVTWGELRAKAAGRPFAGMLDVVNRFWNAWPYRLDSEVWGREDFWASPAEFLSRSGDCEDYCIAKYFTLRELGVPAGDMRIVVVRETVRGAVHAVLAVYEGRQVHILDNLVEHVRPMRRVRNYEPYFSVNENGRWMHVKAKPPEEGNATENGHGTER
jgi:predicted transglutaminase-like cysteine proteinase